MKTAERVVMVAIVMVLVGGVALVYFTMKYNHQAILDGVARGDYEIRDEPATTTPVTAPTEEEEWREVYPRTIPITIAGTPVEASVAATLPDRVKGLSGTPYLPANVVKLFVFGTAASHSIWMKDMNYAIDVIWTDETGTIVHLEENIVPETFPESFGSPTPAWYVIETAAGFVDSNQVAIGDTVVLPGVGE